MTKRRDKDQIFASWLHIIKIYEIDLYSLNGIRQLKNLTHAHIYPNKIKKVSVHHCTEVFSNKTSDYMKKLIRRKGKDYQLLFSSHKKKTFIYFS